MCLTFESWFALMKRISSLFQKLCRMDFLVVWPSQVTSPLGDLWLLQARGLWLPRFLQSFLSSLSGALWGDLVGSNEPGISIHCRVKSLWIPSQCCQVAVPSSHSLISCAPSWPRAVGHEPWTCQWRPCPGGPEHCCTAQHFILTPSQTTPEGIQSCLTRVVNRGST